MMDLNIQSYRMLRHVVSERGTNILSLTVFLNLIQSEPLFYAPVAFLKKWA